MKVKKIKVNKRKLNNLGRRGIGIELKPEYYQTAVRNVQNLESEMDNPTLFDYMSKEGSNGQVI